jgi:hypothetical protein
MQTAYTTVPAIGREGQFATELSVRTASVLSRISATAVKAGRAVFSLLGTGLAQSFDGDPGSVWQQASPASPALVTAIIASGLGSTAGIQTLTTFNGTYGGSASEIMKPARAVTLVLDNHADWDATTAVLTGVCYDGVTRSENLAIPNGGNATVTSVNTYRYVTSLVIPAQAATGGTATLGVSALDATITIADVVGIALFDMSEVPSVTPSQDQTAEFAENDIVPIAESGEVYVITEDACTAGGTPFVRTLAGTGTDLGSFRSDGDSSTAVSYTGATFRLTSGANGLNIVKLPA